MTRSLPCSMCTADNSHVFNRLKAALHDDYDWLAHNFMHGVNGRLLGRGKPEVAASVHLVHDP